MYGICGDGLGAYHDLGESAEAGLKFPPGAGNRLNRAI